MVRTLPADGTTNLTAYRLLPCPLDPNYGAGIVRRRIRLTNDAGRIDAHLSDTFHELHCVLRHAEGVVTSVECDAIRVPTSGCPNAASALRALVGTPLSASRQELYRRELLQRNCTHMYDLAILAMAQAMRRQEPSRVYDIAVPDEKDGSVCVEVRRGDVAVHQWHIQDATITAPSHLAGQSLLSGFTAWASRIFTGDDLEAALVLAKTVFISPGNRYETEALAGQALRRNAQMTNACYAYSEQYLDEHRFLTGTRRDFTTKVSETDPVPFDERGT